MIREFNGEDVDGSGERTGDLALAIAYHPGNYQHEMLCHVADHIITHGPMLKYSSWVLESANKIWKKFMTDHSTHARTATDVTSVHRQALERYLRLTHPPFRAASRRNARKRGVYVCGKCLEPKPKGHARNCRGFPVAPPPPPALPALQADGTAPRVSARENKQRPRVRF